MVLRVPRVDPRLANITAPQLPRINVLGALQQGFGRGDIDRQNRQQEQLQGVLQAQGPAALGGDVAALQEIALQGEDGAELAANLQKIVMGQNDQEFKVAQQELKKQGTFLASLVNADPDVQRRKIFDRANELLSEGDRKNGAEFLRISQLKDPLEIKGELQNALTLVTGGDKFLQSFLPQTGARPSEFTKGKEFLTKDSDNNLILNTSVFDKRTGVTDIKRSRVTEELVNSLGDTGDEESLRVISDAGGKAGAAAKAKLSVQAAQDAFEQVVTIDAGITLLDEGIASLKAGADVGILDKFLPSIKEASSRFDNVAQRMGLQVVSSVTFGALSEGELTLAMATAVPPNLNSKQLITWFEDRKAAQVKLRGFYIDIARQASEEGKTPAEIMVSIENEKKSSVVEEATSGASEEDIIETMRANNMTREQVLQRLGQ